MVSNGKRLVFDEVRRHIIQNGFDLTYTIWSLHGEKQSKYPVVDIVEDENIKDRGLENLVDACYGVHEGVRGDVYGGATNQISDFEQPFVPEPDLGKKYAEYKSKAEEKLYPSCEGPVTTLSAIVELHDLKKQFITPITPYFAPIISFRFTTPYNAPVVSFSRVGYWIRAVVPISYASWDKVDDSFKDEVWLKLMEEFQLNVNPTMGARKNIEKWFAPKFRYWKYALRGKILKNYESEQEAISSCPTGFDPIHWEAFAIHENRQEVKDMCAKNAKNISMNLIGHTCGRKPYGRILEELDESNPEKKHRRTDSWKYGHKHRDGTVLECAQEYYVSL
ncbi:hypothetical protein IFM89_016454 [Coptis chinensis]|uniref:Uncharacterized protein n=1 Tax=Coptis chinensis TaxID=261450 RepID=A0A835HYV3_9MAGN|nr:hypothetical protein IFM89_016454 [Coptis chinensis]